MGDIVGCFEPIDAPLGKNSCDEPLKDASKVTNETSFLHSLDREQDLQSSMKGWEAWIFDVVYTHLIDKTETSVDLSTADVTSKSDSDLEIVSSTLISTHPGKNLRQTDIRHMLNNNKAI